MGTDPAKGRQTASPSCRRGATRSHDAVEKRKRGGREDVVEKERQGRGEEEAAR